MIRTEGSTYVPTVPTMPSPASRVLVLTPATAFKVAAAPWPHFPHCPGCQRRLARGRFVPPITDCPHCGTDLEVNHV